jgi:hypothetical protein
LLEAGNAWEPNYHSVVEEEMNIQEKPLISQISLLSIVYTVIFHFLIPAGASPRITCREAVDGPNGPNGSLVAISLKAPVIGTSRSLDELLANPGQLSAREKAQFAKAVDYYRSRNPQRAVELEALGLPKDQVLKLIGRVLKKDLAILEAEGPTLSLFHDQAYRHNSMATISPKSLDAFSERYDLSPERLTTSSLLGYRGSWAVGVRPEEAMKAALMTGDRELISRSFRQALKYGHVSELTAIAAETKNNSALIELGRLGVARYLFFDRNLNWLGDGLRSFSEVTGEDKKQVEQMLFDLYDLMRSPAIVENEAIVRIYDKAGEVSNYESDAIEVLISTLPVARRTRGDSSARFEYLYQRTDDPRYVDRVEKLLVDSMKKGRKISAIAGAIVYIKNSATLLRIARAAEAYSRQVPLTFDERDRYLFVKGAMRVARDAFAMSGDLGEIQAYMNRVLADPRFQHERPIGFSMGVQELLVSEDVIKLFRSFLADPNQLREGTSLVDLKALRFWLESYDYRYQKNSGEVEAISKIVYGASFRHEEQVIRHALREGEGALPEIIQVFNDTGNKHLGAQDYWQAMLAFIASRNIGGLERTYDAMMTMPLGRPLDAVYAALAIEWIRTGHSPFEGLTTIPARTHKALPVSQ